VDTRPESEGVGQVKQYFAIILADSRNPARQRTTTVQVTVPLVIWAEVLTHRSLARNARSNRAVPSRVLIREVLANPFVPHYWGRNKSGMQAGEELTGWRLWIARQVWLKARYAAVAAAWTMARCGLHKQDANRVLSPWQWIDAVITGDEGAWEAFFALRCHPLADPKVQKIAEMIRTAINESKPQHLRWGEWHLPYYPGCVTEKWVLGSAGACARVSYACFDGKQSDEENAKLAERLISEKPAHASPLEHVVRASRRGAGITGSGPIRGSWITLRELEGV